jgi:hypothetical protein
MLENDNAIKKMFELIILSKDKDIYLVCYEKEPKLCHRSIVHEILDKSRERMRGLIVDLRDARWIIQEEIEKMLAAAQSHSYE